MASANAHPNGNGHDPMLTPAQVADVLGVSTRWVYERIKIKELRAFQLGKYLKIHRADLDAFVAARQVGR